MMEELGRRVSERLAPERALFIGFAETATAVGALVARSAGGSYIHTTRETAPGASYWRFSEAHSHAPEQKLCTDAWESLIAGRTHIVFVEDEISTGNTILNAIALLKREAALDATVRFSAASLINAMNEETLQRFAAANIGIQYLVHIDRSGFDERAAAILVDEDARHECRSTADQIPPLAVMSGKRDPRQGLPADEYYAACSDLANAIVARFVLAAEGTQRLLVLGTEECMLPAILTGAAFQKANPRLDVYTHATTRSPIAPASTPEYPVREGFRLRSVYDLARETFLYNLERYDTAFIISDTPAASSSAFADIGKALAYHGCGHLVPVVWTGGSGRS
jgi:hypothetical protein